MNTKLPQPLFFELPLLLIPKIHSKGDKFYYGNILLELRGVVLFMKIHTWKGVESAHNAGVDLNRQLCLLESFASSPSHQILLMKIKATRMVA